MFEREDWTLFRNLGTLGQKAGVPLRKLAALVVKELADNALDAGAKVRLDLDADSGWITVEDDGPGLPADAAFLARLFSIRRPLTSSKLVRLPTRGALGNGLRVVVGAVLASRGELVVETGGQAFTLLPQDDGTTQVSTAPSAVTTGTQVRLRLGDSVPLQGDVLRWGRLANSLAAAGKRYHGKTSPWWYDSDSFFEMTQAAGDRPLADLLLQFRDIRSAQAQMLGDNRTALSLTRAEADVLLRALREASKAPPPSALGRMGDMDDFAYAHESGLIEVRGHGALAAQLPFSIDIYVRTLEDHEADVISVLVNRSPITGEISLQRQKAHQLGIIGCGLRHLVDVGRKPVQIYLNVTTPYMPITTDGKEPDLHRYLDPIFRAIMKAAKKAKRQAAEVAGPKRSQRDLVVEHLQPAIDKASGGGRYRYSLRQLFYAVRPYLIEHFGKEPDYGYFAQVITDIEAASGADLPGLYRDARGIIYHPHTGEEIPLGTLAVEQYKRPEWAFNKILYSEKEGFFSILKDAGWPEANDCALLTSKGFASRAARDVLDLIGDSQEEIYFFCIHDADASGTLIYQSLTEATRARGARKVHVINLGLDPKEAMAMGLQVEHFRDEGKTTRRLPVAGYIDAQWANWLQTQRVELNAMSSPQFITWLDDKFAEYANKVVPPKRVLAETYVAQTREAVSRGLARQILTEAGFEARVDALVAAAQVRGDGVDLESVVREGLEAEPKSRWSRPLGAHAEALAATILRDDEGRGQPAPRPRGGA